MMNPSLPDLSSEHRTEPIPPEPNRLVADIDTTLKQKILDLPQRERIADVHHHREANDLGRRGEISEGIAHHRMLSIATARLKPIWSDKAVRAAGLAIGRVMDL